MNLKKAKRLRRIARRVTRTYRGRGFPVSALVPMTVAGRFVCLVNLPNTFRHKYRSLKKRYASPN